MNWLLVLRLFDLALIGLSVGFTAALYWHLDTVSVSRYLRHARSVYLVSYVMLSIAAMSEIQIAIEHDTGVSWRTLIVTAAALASAFASAWCWANWRHLQQEMKVGVP